MNKGPGFSPLDPINIKIPGGQSEERSTKKRASGNILFLLSCRVEVRKTSKRCDICSRDPFQKVKQGESKRVKGVHSTISVTIRTKIFGEDTGTKGEKNPT